MPVQHWLTRYHTGVASIDQLHDELFDRMDRVYTDIINKSGAALVSKQVGELADKLIEHLDEEEGEMRASGYAEIEPHIANHRALRTQLAALKKRANAGGNVGTDALDALNQYFTTHIKQFDLPWAKTLAK
ncbi:MAG: hemerythrin family protein [Planctomycetes bacterium]|nr:hemerythrin family protein [Planctomycetota bacterium]